MSVYSSEEISLRVIRYYVNSSVMMIILEYGDMERKIRWDD